MYHGFFQTNLSVEPSHGALDSNEVLSLGMTCRQDPLHNSFFLFIINFVLSFTVVYAYY